jgi:O-acetyl-ADP-ribose deacetylase (regulator of RNase III)
MEKRFSNGRIMRLVVGDITRVAADAIVNAANSRLAGGGGVDGAIPRYVFHAVGPIYRGGAHGEAELLASCYRTCLRLAEEREVAVISFPSISTGVYGYPIQDAAPIALGEVSEHLNRPGAGVQEVIFVLFAQSDCDVYMRVLDGLPAAKVE